MDFCQNSNKVATWVNYETLFFRGRGPNGGFGVWQLFPPNPALAGNACRWAARQLTEK
jgi:hypothetical protein